MATRSTSDSRRIVYRPPLRESDPYYVPAYEPGYDGPPQYNQPVVVRSSNVASPRRMVVVRNPKNPQMDNQPAMTDGNKPIYVMRRPTETSRSTKILSPDRAPPMYVDNSQAVVPYVAQRRPRSRTPSPIRTYYSQPPPRQEQHNVATDDGGYFSCFGDLCGTEDNPPPPYGVQNVHPSRAGGQYSTNGRYPNEMNYRSTENSVRKSRWQQILDLLSKRMCLIIFVCLVILVIAMACLIICAAFLATTPSVNSGLKIAGIVIGAVLAMMVIIFLCFLLCSLGQRDGFFSYFGKRPHIGGQAYALMPSPNSQPYGQPTTTVYPSTTRSSNVIYQPGQMVQRPMALAPAYENKPNKTNIVLELPNHLVSGGNMSPRTRDRSLNKVVKNIGQVVDQAKKRNHGDVPSTVVVRVD